MSPMCSDIVSQHIILGVGKGQGVVMGLWHHGSIGFLILLLKKMTFLSDFEKRTVAVAICIVFFIHFCLIGKEMKQLINPPVWFAQFSHEGLKASQAGGLVFSMTL